MARNGGGKMRAPNEVRIFQQALKEAQKHLVRWAKLGKRLRKTADPVWKSTLSSRRELVKRLRTLVKLAKQRSQH
jgi:hypothetical protein